MRASFGGCRLLAAAVHLKLQPATGLPGLWQLLESVPLAEQMVCRLFPLLLPVQCAPHTWFQAPLVTLSCVGVTGCNVSWNVFSNAARAAWGHLAARRFWARLFGFGGCIAFFAWVWCQGVLVALVLMVCAPVLQAVHANSDAVRHQLRVRQLLLPQSILVRRAALLRQQQQCFQWPALLPRIAMDVSMRPVGLRQCCAGVEGSEHPAGCCMGCAVLWEKRSCSCYTCP